MWPYHKYIIYVSFPEEGLGLYVYTNLSSNQPINMLAKDSATLVPIAVPPVWRKCLLSNWKLLQLSTRCRRSQIELLVGLCIKSRVILSDILTAVIPSSLGILAYKLVTSRVHNSMSLVNLM